MNRLVLAGVDMFGGRTANRQRMIESLNAHPALVYYDLEAVSGSFAISLFISVLLVPRSVQRISAHHVAAICRG